MQYAYQSIQILLPWEPFRVSGNCYFDQKAGALIIPFSYVGEREHCACGEELHIHAKRKIRLHAPAIGLHSKVFWEVEYHVYRCPECDCYYTQYIPFRFGRTKCTTFLAKQVCDDLDSNSRTIKDTAKQFHLCWDTVKSIHALYLNEVFSKAAKPDEPSVCVVDEFSIEKRHTYATLVINAATKEVLYLHTGNAMKDFRPFFHEYNSSWYNNIVAFAMDQNAQYNKVVTEEMPEAVIVADYFHMLKNFTEQVIDKVRLRSAKVYLHSGDRSAYARIKSAKRLLSKRLKDVEEVETEEEWNAQFMLQSMMDDNQELDVCIHMREALQDMYENCRDVAEMEKRWDEWIAMARASGITELSKFADNKDKRRTEILNHAKMPITSGIIEGCMNKIKVIKRTGFGFRDWNYFFNRIRYAFLPYEKKMKAREVLWKSYEADSYLDFLASDIDQQKVG